jgi:hypothetical protein
MKRQTRLKRSVHSFRSANVGILHVSILQKQWTTMLTLISTCCQCNAVTLYSFILPTADNYNVRNEAVRKVRKMRIEIEALNSPHK